MYLSAIDFTPQHFSRSAIPGPTRDQRRSPQRTTGRFVKGPIPLDWLAGAAALPGKALQVGLLLWYLAGLTKRRHDLPLSPSCLPVFGLDRFSAARELTRLEAAGLVTVRRQRGRAPRVTLLQGPTACRSDDAPVHTATT
jgi:hypothetical protein